MFQDGPNKAISSTSWCNRAEAELTFIPQSTPWYTRVKACRSKRSITQAFPTEWTHVDTHAHTISSRDCLNMYTHTTDLIRFPFNNFKYYLTLFSKFFSSFPHGTCSLSVSCHYLALDGIYHPFRTALPSNSTRWEAIVRCIVLATNGVFTLHDPVFQLNSARHTTDLLSIDYNSNCCLIYKLSSSRFTRRYWGNPS